MSPGFALLLSILVLVAGPVLAWLLEQRAYLRSCLEGFVLVMVGGLCLMFLLPHAFERLGIWAFVVAPLGFFIPALIERISHGEGHTHGTGHDHGHDPHDDKKTPEGSGILLLALLGLLIHCVLDGAGLGIDGGAAHLLHDHGAHDHGAGGHDGQGHAPDDHHGHGAGGALTLAILAHRLPVGLLLWSSVSPYGRGWAVGAIGATIAATLTGFALAPHLHHMSEATGPALIEGLLAGGLLHVVLDHGPRREPTRWCNPMSAVGAGVALLFFALLPLEPPAALSEGLAAALRLLDESAAAVLLGFLGAGLLSLVPADRLARLMRGRTTFGSAVRGLLFGLPVPICSCGVVPIYRGLVQKGVPPAAAMAFLIATPELGIDALAVSVPLLGWELTLARLLAAAALALVAGLCMGAMVGRAPPPSPSQVSATGHVHDLEDDHDHDNGQGHDHAHDHAHSPGPARARSPWQRAFRYGFVESVDELGPWILAGLLVAGLLEPTLSAETLAVIPDAIEVPAWGALAAPIYVCASGATPVAAALLLKGVTAGAVIAFLLTGPATNVTTYGALRGVYGLGRTLAILLIVFLSTVALGLLVNVVLPGVGAPVNLHAEHAPSALELTCRWVLLALFAASLARLGPRGLLDRLGLIHHHRERGHGHENGHDQEHGHELPSREKAAACPPY